MKKYNYIGKGIYSVSQVSHYTGISPQKISRWTKGYLGKENKSFNPLYKPDFAEMDKKLSLSFLDLIEIRFIDAFYKHGVSWKAIRIAAEKAKQIIGHDHPFSSRQFFTDRKSILSRIAVSENEGELLNLVNNQYELDEILRPYLIEGIDYSDMDIAQRWFPLGKENPIMIDPQINFGRPVISHFNVDTRLIYEMHKKNKSAEDIAFWYDLDISSVQSAIDYEKQIAA